MLIFSIGALDSFYLPKPKGVVTNPCVVKITFVVRFFVFQTAMLECDLACKGLFFPQLRTYTQCRYRLLL